MTGITEMLGYNDNITTLPLEMDVGSENSEETAEFLELETGERLRENVCDHVVGRTIL
jgi:hypothetical protein